MTKRQERRERRRNKMIEKRRLHAETSNNNQDSKNHKGWFSKFSVLLLIYIQRIDTIR